MKERMRALPLLALLLAIPLAVLAVSWRDLPRPTVKGMLDGSYFTGMDQAVAGELPAGRQLRLISLRLGLLGGQMEQNDIFISADGLVKNIPAADAVRVQQNVDSILHFAAEADIPTYLLLVPTPSAVLQEQLPPYAELYNNQKQMIDDVYRQMSGRVTVVDVYGTLFNRRNEYIYYRTENNLTALGGYYVYSVLGRKLVGQEVHGFSQFEIAYINDSYTGSLYQQSPYPDVKADVLSIFRYSGAVREYTVTHTSTGSSKVYHTLYPLHLLDLGQDMDVYFGGLSAITHMRVSSPYARSLLVFGDETALAYLPFLANNYQNITLVDLSQLTYEYAGELDLGQYDQVLYAYSVETFSTNVPIWAEMLL